MTPHTKKFFGMLILLFGFFFYAILAITIADYIPSNKILQIIYFAVAGIIWVFPVRPLMIWMNSDPNSSTQNSDSPPKDHN